MRPIEIAYNLCELVDRGTVASLTSLEAILAQLTERGTVVRWKTAVLSVHSFFAHSSLLVNVANYVLFGCYDQGMLPDDGLSALWDVVTRSREAASATPGRHKTKKSTVKSVNNQVQHRSRMRTHEYALLMYKCMFTAAGLFGVHTCASV